MPSNNSNDFTPLKGIHIRNGKVMSGSTGTSVPIATTGSLGVVKPDGSTITVDADGTIHSAGGSGNYLSILNDSS